MSADVIRELQTAIRTGKVVLGYRRTLKELVNDRAKLVVVAKNAPSHIVEELKYYASLSQTLILVFEGSSRELGAACRKPFMVSALAVLDPGESNILHMIRGEG
uniref:Large ribosomal subunit protein eL30 n=1 Tax=Thermofilum pendens TaxID=2269 RepID=A0A7C4BBY4_THEPE